jgi:chemotaxis protein methyltransferase CheR
MLSRQLGLSFAGARGGDLERGLAAAAAELGFSGLEACADWLLSTSLRRSQVETLAAHLTVGETYLMREPKAFDTLERAILPRIIRERRAGSRQLRLWSAGCASGEEVYSIAITVARALPDIQDWHVTILGTDINPLALRKAAAGVYGEWSFRRAPDWMRERYFEPAGARRYRIVPPIRRMVSFDYLNLADDAYPSLLSRTNAMDVIFCRNVLLYFAPERVAAVLEKFRRALLPGRWLVGGVAEQFRAPGFAPAAAEGAAIFRNESPAVALPIRQPCEIPLAGRNPSHPALPTPCSPPPPPEMLSREAANSGRLNDALGYCDAAIAREKLRPAHHYLRATILTELGRLNEAEMALRGALFLDPDFVLAHFAAGTIARRLGRLTAFHRHLDRALELLTRLPPDAIVPESDGITAGRLAAIIQATLTAHPA